MKITIKPHLTAGMAVLLVFTPMFVHAHGLDGHHAPLLTVLQHLLTEHGYILALPIALGMLWYAKRRNS